MGWPSPSVTDICFLLVVISFVAVDGYVFNGPFVFINNNILKCMLIKGNKKNSTSFYQDRSEERRVGKECW